MIRLELLEGAIMKKNRKYLSSAVALTLLATAPVVAPVIATEFEGTVVKAEDSTEESSGDTTETADPAVVELLTEFKSQFDDRYVSDPSRIVDAINTLSGYNLNLYAYFSKDAHASMHDLQHDEQVRKLMDQSKLKSDNLFQSNQLVNAKYPDLYGYFTVKDKDGVDQPMSTKSEMKQFTSNLKTMMPITITVHVYSWDNNGQFTTDSLTGISDEPGGLLNFDFVTGINAFDVKNNIESVPVNTELSKLDNSSNTLEITDNYSNSQDGRAATEPSSKPVYGRSIFNTATDAINYAKSPDFDTGSSSATGSLDNLNSNGEITKPGRYYQTVTYDLGASSGTTKENSKDIVLYNMLTDSIDDITQALDKYTVRSTIGGKTSLVDDGNYYINKSTRTLTTTREIDVTGDATSNIDSPITVDSGTTSTDSKLSNTSKDTLKYKDTPLADDPTSDGNFYKSNPLTDESATPVDNALNTPGKYYRLLTFDLGNNDPSLYNFGTKGTYKVDGSKVSFVQEVDVKAPNDATVNINKDVTITAGASSKDSALTDTTKDTLVDGKTTLLTDPTPGEVYYDKDPSKDTKATEVSDALNTPGTYYRKLTFNLTDDVSTDKYNFVDGDVSSDGKTVTYYQPITVKAKSSSNSGSSNHDHNWTISYPTGTAKTKNNQSTYPISDDDDKTIDGKEIPKDTTLNVDRARTDQNGNVQYHIADGEWINANYVTFTAGNDTDSDWTYYNDPGYVVTFDKQDYYSLNNQDNKVISNRALDEKTAWYTDQYRTNKAGVKQYRVATGEWIDSHDVIFVKAHKAVVNLDATKSYYDLYNIEEHKITNRALDEKTSWYTDATAEDADGNVYYRVASNEWVKQTDGVHLSQSAWY